MLLYEKLLLMTFGTIASFNWS